MDSRPWIINEGSWRDLSGKFWLIRHGIAWEAVPCECQDDPREHCEICDGYRVVSQEYDRFRNGQEEGSSDLLR